MAAASELHPRRGTGLRALVFHGPVVLVPLLLALPLQLHAGARALGLLDETLPSGSSFTRILQALAILLLAAALAAVLPGLAPRSAG